ncbi:hypothetical protein FH972_003245 [Carpinus fangiana]|uniref:KIB1-4 beta-propeller domain-containing protein n=1 Tax=Carpinus fangiana TaxID=176857 RepID=A0A5N6QK22_9ROSI|nr:hypothetical protein FH972_003245 [Carpinus fangiana]
MLKLFPSSGRYLQRLLCNYGSDNPWNPLKKGLLLVHRLSSSIPRQTLVGRCTASNRVSSYSPWPLGSLRCFSRNKTCEDEDGISSSPCLMCDNCFRPQQLNKLAVACQKTVTLDFSEDVASHGLLGSSSPGWIAVTNKFNGDIVLMNPFTEKIGKVYQATPPVVRLPRTSTMPKMDAIIEAWTRFCIDNEMRTDRIYYDFIRRIVWSSNPMSPDCTVIVVYGPYRNIAFCRPGDKSWSDTALDCKYQYSYIQLLYSNKSKLFYFQRSNGTTFEVWDLQQPSPKMIHRLDHTVDESDQRTLKYLVESLGDILLVVRYLGPPTRPPSKTQGFDVFKLDFRQQTMERVECLGDRVLFLCKYSFSVSAQDFPELNPNSIYFTHDDEEYWPGMYTTDGYTLEYRGGENREDYDIGFYCLEDHSITILYDMEICLHCLRSPGYWVIPKPPYM